MFAPAFLTAPQSAITHLRPRTVIVETAHTDLTEKQPMTALSQTRAIAVRDAVIAGTACFSLLGSHGKFPHNGCRA
jgi:hypothetical protein